ncbi:MoaB/Mog domain-containing protein [Butyriboletus roseoflavus]|nr:MoaB/Mog domain-containing protein [Butyriboletus roseoflavus]
MSPSFAVSPVPTNPLGDGKYIQTAAALIIGYVSSSSLCSQLTHHSDEILNGKTLDRNSNYFARFCFEHGIDLKRVEVIADDEDEIAEASRRMVERYDLVITSGGIGPTHDDITYASLAKAFGQQLSYHAETLTRMEELIRLRPSFTQQNEEQRIARKRMALFPHAAEVLFVAPDIWVPVVRLGGKLCVFPGIPSLFQKMLDSLKHLLPLPPPDARPCRLQVFTNLPESSIAPYLTTLQKRVTPEGIRIGSYPLVLRGVYVSLIGANHDRIRELAVEVEEEVQGRIVSEEEAEAKRRSGNRPFELDLSGQHVSDQYQSRLCKGDHIVPSLLISRIDRPSDHAFLRDDGEGDTHTKWKALGGTVGPVVPDSPTAKVVPSCARTLVASPETISGVGPLQPIENHLSARTSTRLSGGGGVYGRTADEELAGAWDGQEGCGDETARGGLCDGDGGSARDELCCDLVEERLESRWRKDLGVVACSGRCRHG